MKKHLPAAIAALLLFACSPPQNRQSELCRYAPDDTVDVPADNDTAYRALDAALARFSEQTRPAGQKGQRAHCGHRLALSADRDESALLTAVGKKLGQDWHYRTDAAEGRVRLHYWQSGGSFWPRQYFVLALGEAAADGSFRPLETLYLQNRSSPLHGSVVYGTAAATALLPPVLFFYFRRRRRATRNNETKKISRK